MTGANPVVPDHGLNGGLRPYQAETVEVVICGVVGGVRCGRHAGVRENDWYARYEQAHAVKTQHGQVSPLPRTLKNWLCGQRVKHRTCRLPPEHEQLQRDLGAI